MAEPAVAELAGGEAAAPEAWSKLKRIAGVRGYLQEVSSPVEVHGGAPAAELSGGGSSGVTVLDAEASPG